MPRLDNLTLTAESKAGSAKGNAQTKDVATGFPSDYKPVAGDRVKSKTRGWTAEVIEVSADRFKLKDDSASSWYRDATAFELVSKPAFIGTYAERQKQWIKHHGLTVGSKVKVVRKFKRHEGDCWCAALDACHSKATMLQGTFAIDELFNGGIRLGGTQHAFPYFALEPVAD